MKIKCPSCNAALIFDATSGKMECKYCGCMFDVEDVADQESKQIEKENVKEETMECNIYSCTECGAELAVNGVEAATFCAYCGQPTIVFRRVSQEMRPKWIIPFKVQKEEAIEAIRARFRKGLFVPKEVKNFEIERVSGVYIPYWIYDTYYYDTQLIKGTVKNGKFEKTMYYEREADCEFTKITLDASSKLSDESSQRLEPFYTDELLPFEVAYMSGYYADRFDQNGKVIREKARERTQEYFDGQMLASVKAYDCEIVDSNPKFEVKKEEYALFPAWFLSFRYKDKSYTMLVNGQTGKVVGTPPSDKKRVKASFISIFALSACGFIPLCISLITQLGISVDSLKIIIGLLAVALWMGRDAIHRLWLMQFNESLTSDSEINQYAHNRQKQ